MALAKGKRHKAKNKKEGDAPVNRPPKRVKTDASYRYFNKEINWLEFDLRVLEEAENVNNPLLERVKFLSIFSSNLDEFFMIRVSGLLEQVDSGLMEPSDDGLTPLEQLAVIRTRVLQLIKQSSRLFKNDFLPALKTAGIHICNYDDLNDAQKKKLRSYFEQEVYPVLTPLAFDPGHPFPHISNLSLNLAVVIRGLEGEHFARVKIPGILPRLVPVEWSQEQNASDDPARARQRGFVWLEQLVAANLEMLFPGVKVLKSYPFRVIRDADLEIREDEAGDLLQVIQASLNRQRFGDVVFLSVEKSMPENIRLILSANLEIDQEDIYPIDGPMGLSDLMQLYDVDMPWLKEPLFRPRLLTLLQQPNNIFRVLKNQDILLHQPYDSFSPVVEFIQAASSDPEVLAIKQTIYRVGSNSPIVEALARAATNGKQVSVLVELKARFDEENNIEWARALEKAGAHVVYGKIELKTHCKVALVVRKEPDGIRRYVHLGTGNYNVKTAQIYTDLGLLTSKPEFGADATTLFNSLTGYSLQASYSKLLVSPGGIRQAIMEKIEREIRHAKEGREGRLIFKMNALVDFDCIDALYRASQAGVKIDLLVRGMCSLVPGVAGLSENIKVISIVGRFLEHSRIYYFRNGDAENEEVYLGSADIMQRNLDRRVETLFPLEDPFIKHYVIGTILPTYLKDNVNAQLLMPDGRYKHCLPENGQEPFSAQKYLMEHTTENELHILPSAGGEVSVVQ
jgi:polyphosphate kinase